MSNIPKGGKIENISLLHNFFFDSKTFFAWKQFEIGTGKEFTATSIQSTIASACITVIEKSSMSLETKNRNRVHVTETASNINTENVENIESDQRGVYMSRRGMYTNIYGIWSTLPSFGQGKSSVSTK